MNFNDPISGIKAAISVTNKPVPTDYWDRKELSIDLENLLTEVQRCNGVPSHFIRSATNAISNSIHNAHSIEIYSRLLKVANEYLYIILFLMENDH